jgi:hypothetical protein
MSKSATTGLFGLDLLSHDQSRYFRCFELHVFMSKRGDSGKRSGEGDLGFEAFSFGSIRINGTTYEHDVVIDRGHVSKRNKKPSKKFRSAFGHTPLSIEEDIPWKCQRLVVGTGTGALPIMDEVKHEADRREIELVILPTAEAIKTLQENPVKTNAILHVTC